MTPRGGNVPALTGLRGLAAAWVLLFHVGQFAGGAWRWAGAPTLGGVPLDPLALLRCGYFGVDLFFVLSGFLLSLPFHRAAAGQAPPPSLARFWRHRARRVLPAYWFQLIVLAVAFCWVGRQADLDPRNLLAHVLLAQNLSPWPFPLLNPVYWSMPVEWDFYVLLPLLALPFARRRAGVAVVAAFALAIGARWLVAAMPSDPWIAALGRLLLPARIDQFVVGMAGAWLLVHRPQWIARPDRWLLGGTAGVALVALIAAPHGDSLPLPYAYWHHSALALAFGAIVLGAAAGAPLARRWLGGPVAGALGTVSFSLYLWHFPVLQLGLLWQVYGEPPALWRVAAFALPASLLLATLSYRWIERPFLQRRD